MTQNANDVEIANQGFAAFRQDLNDVLEDITTLHSGTAAPSTTYANQFWYDTDNKLYIRNEDNDAWIELFTLDQVNDKLTQIGSGDITVDGSVTAETNTLDVTTGGSTLYKKGGTNSAFVGDVAAGLGSGDGLLLYTYSGTNRPIISYTNGSERMRLTHEGNLELIQYNKIRWTHAGGGTIRGGISADPSDNLRFFTGSSETERMRVDGSGNLLVGTTDTSPYNNSANSSSDNGAVISEGRIWAARSGGSPIDVNRTTSDGDIILLRKSGTTVGSIATIASTMYLYTGNVGLRFGASNDVRPCFSTGLNRDNAIDLGTISARFDDIYATNGTIQTSDRNEKQQIASLTAAEITAAKAISKLFKTFKWNDSVTENGDNARTHAGVIAQDVQQAMTDAGLDAGDYAFFISSTWWETSTDVPAVAAVAEVLDSDGNVVTEAVEAADAYTRVETYDTQADAPAGATERTRLGIRYPELLAFVGAATEQRLADIETRLTALEAV